MGGTNNGNHFLKLRGGDVTNVTAWRGGGGSPRPLTRGDGSSLFWQSASGRESPFFLCSNPPSMPHFEPAPRGPAPGGVARSVMVEKWPEPGLFHSNQRHACGLSRYVTVHCKLI